MMTGSDPVGGEWECEAYGPGGLAVGAACFIGGRVYLARACDSAVTCHRIMAAERLKLWELIKAKAAAGDPDFIYLAESFTSPDMLLGGPASGALADG
jgi:hypothetical protein